jgi:hypothetical protein
LAPVNRMKTRSQTGMSTGIKSENLTPKGLCLMQSRGGVFTIFYQDLTLLSSSTSHM